MGNNAEGRINKSEIVRFESRFPIELCRRPSITLRGGGNYETQSPKSHNIRSPVFTHSDIFTETATSPI